MERFVWVRNKWNYAVLFDNKEGKIVTMIPIPEFRWIRIGRKALLVDLTTGRVVLKKRE